MPHETKLGPLTITWFGHASFLVTDGNTKIYLDPYVLPSNPEKADIILITHEHYDHCPPENVAKVKKDDTKLFSSAGGIKKIGFGTAMAPGKVVDQEGIMIKAVEAYNTNKFRSPGNPFHLRGLGVGFVVEISGKKIYHPGDTDYIPEMKELQKENIDLAMLPIGGLYTMDYKEAAEAAFNIKPKFLIPMHYNSDKYNVSGINADPIEVAKLLVGKGIVVNILTPMV